MRVAFVGVTFNNETGPLTTLQHGNYEATICKPLTQTRYKKQ